MIPATVTLAETLAKVATTDGFTPACVPDVVIMRSTMSFPPCPISYSPSIVIIAQGTKRGRLGTRRFTYDPDNYLVLSVPLPFECETIGTPEKPMLGLAIQLNPTTVAELVLEMDDLFAEPSHALQAIDAIPLTPELYDAALRLAKCLRSPLEARILGGPIVREITYLALRGAQGAAIRAIASPQTNFGRVARVLRRIHLDFAQPIDIPSLARESGMSVSAFHAHFKAVTAHPPLHYLQTVRLHKALALMVAGLSVTETAEKVGYVSASQFSREFKRLFGCPPKEAASLYGRAASMRV